MDVNRNVVPSNCTYRCHADRSGAGGSVHCWHGVGVIWQNTQTFLLTAVSALHGELSVNLELPRHGYSVASGFLVTACTSQNSECARDV